MRFHALPVWPREGERAMVPVLPFHPAGAPLPDLDFLTNAFVTLLVTIDPIGLAPIFLALTQGFESRHRREVALRAAIIASLILVVFTLVGERTLDLLGITIPAFRVAGGMLLFWTAFEMVFEKRDERRSTSVDRAITRDHIRNVAVFPLAIPLISGPGSISAVILLSSQASSTINLIALIGVILGLILACLVVFLAATPIDKLLGETGRMVLSRLLGVILAALAVQFVADGVKALAMA